jgi:ABC-2 type transport system permease protein
MNVIYVLWVRQMKRFLRVRARVIASLGQPVLFLVAFGFGLGPVFSRGGFGNYIQFLAPGLMGMTLMLGGIGFGANQIWDRRFGFLQEILVAPVPRMGIIIGRTLSGATIALVSGVLICAVSYIAGFRAVGPAAVGSALFVMALIALLFTAFGSVMASMVEDFQAFQIGVNYLVMPMFLLSGALFPLNAAPRPLQIIAGLDPFAYAVDGLRTVLLGGGSRFHMETDLTVLAVLTLLFMLLDGRLLARTQM